MKTAELQSSRNKSSWKWSSSKDGAAGAAQLQEKAPSREGPGHGGQESKDTVLGTAAEETPTAWGNLAVPRLVPSPQWGERGSVPHTHPTTTALQPEQSHCHWPPHCWAGCPHGEGHRPAPLGPERELPPPPSFSMEPMSALGQRDRPLAVQSLTHGGSHKTDPVTIWSILVL